MFIRGNLQQIFLKYSFTGSPAQLAPVTADRLVSKLKDMNLKEDSVTVRKESASVNELVNTKLFC